ncbi:neuropeptide FF receptor 2-like protein [Dinothrombium tinctorium]|uniref:Neuropeptide FF receptor 2-like protein n=1 Tax=Dinothrombium tinctorium TaxID=1965070 RepID=A0A443R0B9_9ACAR|nr:neuropeptide FF receptor 2-like protein [Dinothrombium tinctorium]
MSVDVNETLNNITSVECEQLSDITSYNFSIYDFVDDRLNDSFTYVDYIKLCVTVVIIVVALFGNFAVIISVIFNRLMRTTINLYLINLAIADVLISTFCMLVYLINNLTEPLYILGSFVCKFNAFTQILTGTYEWVNTYISNPELL